MELKRPSSTSALNAASSTAGDLPRSPPPPVRLKSGMSCTVRPALRATTSMSVVFCRAASASWSWALLNKRSASVLAVFGLQVALALLEGLDRGRLDAVELEDVVAELRLHGPADLAFLHAERRIGERRHPGLAVGPAEIPALLRGSRVLREFLGEFGEVLARLGALQNVFGLRLDGGIVFRIGDLQQDVPHAALLRLRVALGGLGLLLLEVGLELRIIDAHLRRRVRRG